MTAKITVVVVGADGVAREYPKLVQHAVRLRLTATINRLGRDLMRKVKEQYLRGPAPGKLRRRTGTLSRSINMRIEDTPRRVAVAVGTNLIYGRAWELGTVRGKKGVALPARRFLRPALDEMRAYALAEMAAALGRGGKEA
jgi:hypothetical protein